MVKAFSPEVECRVTPLDEVKVTAIQEAIATEKTLDDFMITAGLRLAGPQGGRIGLHVICCDEASALAMRAKAKNPDAQLGAKSGWLALVYHHQPAVVWHEMLHLLGAEDCYKNSGAKDKTCGHDNCVMQYAPTVEVVGDPPFLCEENVQRIGGTWEKYCKRRAAGGGA